MEGIHGVDVSWLHHSAKGELPCGEDGRSEGEAFENIGLLPRREQSCEGNHSTLKLTDSGSNADHSQRPNAQETPASSSTKKHASATKTSPKDDSNETANLPSTTAANGATPAANRPHRPSLSTKPPTTGKAANDNAAPKPSPPSPGVPRRNSWLSSISSKFSSPAAGSPGAAGAASPGHDEAHAHRPPPNAPKGAVLQHGAKEGEAPYTPAVPKSGHPNFLQSALRRLSSSGGQLSSSGRSQSHGLCERRILNVNTHRERCHITELDPGQLRRVAFCVDVEIAGGPRYTAEDGDGSKTDKKVAKKKSVEKGEGEALKHPDEVKHEKEHDGVLKVGGEEVPKEPEKEATEIDGKAAPVQDAGAEAPHENTRKKEKKKRSEEERKARKEKKRKQAEANGTLPVELTRNSSDSSLSSLVPTTTSAKLTHSSPTTDPARIYRRCCQLRETPILKRITEQLSSPANSSTSEPGVVNKLDLTGYWLELADLVTLGDYLAVVPVKEIMMENCGLTDEGVRVILAGLLAARSPLQRLRKKRKTSATVKPSEKPQLSHSGVVERVVFQNNPRIGRAGWQHLCLFINMSRSLKFMDLSMIPFPQPESPSSGSGNLRRTATATVEMSTILSKAIGERPGGAEFELLNLAETGLTAVQLGHIIDGVTKSGLRRLGLAGNHINAEGMEHVARYLRSAKCEGLDLGGNDMNEHLQTLADAIDEKNPLWALSLADCKLTPNSLARVFPALTKLANFRFIDLSHNHHLFEAKPSASSLLRKFLPKMRSLKRIHLTDVSMTSEQAIALAEILPESPGLAHVNILENPQLIALAAAKDAASQEEACALYASLMAAVRVSMTIICIDIDVPSPDSSEVVKALAKQVVAYCLRNMERMPVAEADEAAVALAGPPPGEKEVAVPDVLLHILGHAENWHGPPEEDDAAPDDDYVIGGTGVVKALGICLRKANDERRPSADRTYSDMSDNEGGSATPRPVSGGKAKDMSKNLLESARKIRKRLQPALANELSSGNRMAYSKTHFHYVPSSRAVMITY